MNCAECGETATIGLCERCDSAAAEDNDSAALALCRAENRALTERLAAVEWENERHMSMIAHIWHELDKTLAWRSTSGMKPATDNSIFASTSLSACLQLKRDLAAARGEGGE